MKLYKTKYFDPASAEGTGTVSNWTGTQADARGDRVRLKKEGMVDIETVEIDVPTAKPALLAFLNERKVS